jgi:hypothetical protein
MTAPVPPPPLPDEIEARWDAATCRPTRYKMNTGAEVVSVVSSPEFEAILDGIEELAVHVALHRAPSEDDVFVDFRERMGDTLRQSVVDFVSEIEAARIERRHAIADAVTA